MICQECATQLKSKHFIHALRVFASTLNKQMLFCSCRFRREDRQGQLNELCVKVEQREGDRIRLKGTMCNLPMAVHTREADAVLFMQMKSANWNKTLRASAKATPIRLECYATCRMCSISAQKRQISVRRISTNSFVQQGSHESFGLTMCRGDQ